MIKNIPLLILATLLFAAINGTAVALSTDRDQPANIEADDIEFDFKKGTRTYINNVLVEQGTLRLKADKLLGIYVDGELDNATAWGSLARFKQRPDGKQHDVEGWAKKIVVNQKKNTLTLIGQASLKQGPDTARGHTIIYNMASDTLRVSGGAKLGAGGKDGKSQPKRSIEDPFKDNAQGPPPIGKKKVKKKPAKKTADSDEANDEDPGESDDAVAEEETEEVEEVEEVQPIRSGRSRLIIQPK